MEKVLGILPPLIYIAFAVAEKLFPARPLARVPRWRLKGILFFLLGGVILNTVPRLWAPWAQAHRLIDLERLPTWAGVLVGVVVLDFLAYWAHRLRHRAPLWRLHQMHHSAERLDVAGAFYFHPLDTLVFAFVSTFLASFVVGVSPTAAALVGFYGFFMAVFTHANLRTPRWLGFVIQRPEAHAVHHQRGLHSYNFGTLALWDAVFGTYRNPQAREGEAGFWDGASGRMGALLAGADVSARP
jgi:sterol desaturase/sphingolipid hydroxylase (fatty acid hydroxylase superfamily)